MFSMLQEKLGREGPRRLVVPEALAEPILTLEGVKLEIVEFGEGETKQIKPCTLPN